jgi:acetaldehyde dehydrogenase
MVKVQGLGDYLPKYAGNMDIINCAAVIMAEEYAKHVGINKLIGSEAPVGLKVK